MFLLKQIEEMPTLIRELSVQLSSHHGEFAWLVLRCAQLVEMDRAQTITALRDVLNELNQLAAPSTMLIHIHAAAISALASFAAVSEPSLLVSMYSDVIRLLLANPSDYGILSAAEIYVQALSKSKQLPDDMLTVTQQQLLIPTLTSNLTSSYHEIRAATLNILRMYQQLTMMVSEPGKPAKPVPCDVCVIFADIHSLIFIIGNSNML